MIQDALILILHTFHCG